MTVERMLVISYWDELCFGICGETSLRQMKIQSRCYLKTIQIISHKSTTILCYFAGKVEKKLMSGVLKNPEGTEGMKTERMYNNLTFCVCSILALYKIVRLFNYIISAGSENVDVLNFFRVYGAMYYCLFREFFIDFVSQ